MTVLAHAAIGAMVYATAAHALGASADTQGAMLACGAVLGSLPDGLPWLVGRLADRGDVEQWLREIMHRPAPGAATRIQWLIAPWLHIVADRFVHAPALPDPGTSIAHDREIIRIRTWRFTVRDLLWCAGELVLWLIVASLVLLYRSI